MIEIRIILNKFKKNKVFGANQLESSQWHQLTIRSEKQAHILFDKLAKLLENKDKRW